MTEVQQRFIYWIKERESIREARALGLPPPWTDDPILAQCRFCNVNREHDAVTLWVDEHLRRRYSVQHYGINFMVTNLVLARVFNEPSTLVWLIPLPLDNIKRARTDLAALRAQGKKLFRGAYMMPAHGNGGKGRSTEDYWMRAVEEVSRMDFTSCSRLSEVAEKLMTVKGLGEFLANQVCADLRYVLGLTWKDWTSFVFCGPGSRRGLDRWDGLEPSGNLAQHVYVERLLEVRQTVIVQLPASISTFFRDPNNLSNCFCEFDKYERARDQLLNDESFTLRKYGNPQS